MSAEASPDVRGEAADGRAEVGGTPPAVRSLTARLTLIAALGALPILVIAGASLLWLFSERIEQRFDAVLSAYQQQLIAAMDFAEDGTLRLGALPADPRFNLPFSGWYWQISGEEKTLAQSASAGPLQAGSGLSLPIEEAAADLTGPGDEKLRAVSISVRLPGTAERIHIVVAGPHSEIDQEAQAFGLQLALTLGALGAAFLIATVLQVRYGLLPLGHLRSSLQDIRGGAAQRLIGEYPVEIAPLVGELNDVLDHNTSLIKRARVQAGNLAHALKSPLTVLQQEVNEVSGERGAILREQVGLIGYQVDRVLARIRAAGPMGAAPGRTQIATLLQDLAFSLDLIHRERGIKIEVICSTNESFVGDEGDLAEMLGNLMDNACKWARSRVAITVEGEIKDTLSVLIDDDGPGIPAAQRVAAMKRGGRLDESTPGTGLGLDIVRELAELYHGQLLLEDSPMGGLRARLLLPRD